MRWAIASTAIPRMVNRGAGFPVGGGGRVLGQVSGHRRERREPGRAHTRHPRQPGGKAHKGAGSAGGDLRTATGPPARSRHPTPEACRRPGRHRHSGGAPRLFGRKSVGAPARPERCPGEEFPPQGVRHPHSQVRSHPLLRGTPPRNDSDSGRSRIHQQMGTEVLEEATGLLSPAIGRPPPGSRGGYRQEKPGIRREEKGRAEPAPTGGSARESTRSADRRYSRHGPCCGQRRIRAPTSGECRDYPGGHPNSGKAQAFNTVRNAAIDDMENRLFKKERLD